MSTVPPDERPRVPELRPLVDPVTVARMQQTFARIPPIGPLIDPAVLNQFNESVARFGEPWQQQIEQALAPAQAAAERMRQQLARYDRLPPPVAPDYTRPVATRPEPPPIRDGDLFRDNAAARIGL